MTTLTLGKPVTADGVEFKPGMPLYLFVAATGAIEVKDTQDCEVQSQHFQQHHFFVIGRKGSRAYTDLKHFYSSRRAVVEAEIAKLEAQKSGIDVLIADWRSALEQAEEQDARDRA